MKLSGIIKTIKDPWHLVIALSQRGLLDHLSDETYLKLNFRAAVGKKLDLKNPQTFNEKLQWLKLYDRKTIYTTMVDKYEVKKYVADIIGEEYIIPTLGVWDRFEDIDFDALPNQFVLKCTHDSGGLIICRDKSKLDINAAREKINKALRRDYYLYSREWPYKDVKPRIIAENYMEDEKSEELRDYKFFCFDGEVKVFYITSGRKTGDRRTDFFDLKMNHLDIQDDDKNADIPPEIPKGVDEMIRLAAKLSKGIPHVRVDFYEINGKVYFGELTFFYLSGFVPFVPSQWDEIFGSWITLPEKTEEE